MCVGKKIKSYLESNGITQTFVANRAGIPVQKLNLSLNGNRRLDFDEYELICGALSVGTDKFLEPKLPEQKGANFMSKKKKKKKASKMVRTSKKPISLTCLINKKPICQMDIFR